MFAILSSAIRALGGLFAPGMGRIFFACAALTLVALVALYAGCSWLAAVLLAHYAMGTGFFFWLFSVFGGYLLIMFLFPLVMPILVSFFDEQIAERIERHAYPRLAIGQAQPFWEDFRADLAFTARALLLNLLCLPLILLGPLYIPIYYVLNAYLLGTQFFMMAGGRHIGKTAARALSRNHRLPIILGGLIVLLAAHIPFINLIAPFWGVAMMVHLYQKISPPPQVLPAA